MENPYDKYNAKNWLSLQQNRMSWEQRKELFPGLTTDKCANVPGGIATSGNYDQVTFDNQILSYIAENGQPCWYYPYLFQQEKMQQFTGEHSSAGYGRPFQILMVVQVNDSPSWVSSLGVQNDQTVKAWVHIRGFKQKIYPILNNMEDQRYQDYNTIYCQKPWQHGAYTKRIMPKPKDCFQVLTTSSDRQWDMGARIWQITNVQDQIFSQKFNLSYGHYVWKITAKRYRYSFEYGMSTLDEKSKDNPMLGELGERGNHQVYENDIVKMYLKSNNIVAQDNFNDIIVSQETQQPIIDSQLQVKRIQYQKKYSQKQVCEDAKKQVFDMQKNDTSFYKHLDSGGFF